MVGCAACMANKPLVRLLRARASGNGADGIASLGLKSLTARARGHCGSRSSALSSKAIPLTPQPSKGERAVNAYRTAILAVALVAGAAAQAGAVTPYPRVKVCHPHYEYGPPSQ